jgi:hypothetical protein
MPRTVAAIAAIAAAFMFPMVVVSPFYWYFVRDNRRQC